MGAGIDCALAHLDTLPSYAWGTHVALDVYSNFGMFPLASPWIIPRDSGTINEARYATLLSRQAYVTALSQCADAQSEYYTRSMNYDANWLLMRATALSTLWRLFVYSCRVYLRFAFTLYIERQRHWRQSGDTLDNHRSGPSQQLSSNT